jgi:hypothetical protein
VLSVDDVSNDYDYGGQNYFGDPDVHFPLQCPLIFPSNNLSMYFIAVSVNAEPG